MIDMGKQHFNLEQLLIKQISKDLKEEDFLMIFHFHHLDLILEISDLDLAKINQKKEVDLDSDLEMISHSKELNRFSENFLKMKVAFQMKNLRNFHIRTNKNLRIKKKKEECLTMMTLDLDLVLGALEILSRNLVEKVDFHQDLHNPLAVVHILQAEWVELLKVFLSQQ